MILIIIDSKLFTLCIPNVGYAQNLWVIYNEQLKLSFTRFNMPEIEPGALVINGLSLLDLDRYTKVEFSVLIRIYLIF